MSSQNQTLTDIDIIPQELKKLSKWVLWRKELRGDNPKPTKIPYSAIIPGSKASATDSNTWTIFDDVYHQYKISNDPEKLADYKELDISSFSYHGVGFVLSDNDEYIAWDFDNCYENGNIIEPVASYVKILNSYTEISPSGNGLRIIVCGKLPPNGRKHGPFETYESGRFVTITGNHLQNTPRCIEYRQQEIEQVHGLIFGQREETNHTNSTQIITIIPEDEDILNKLSNAKNGPKFKQLYYEGDFSDYPSISEARFALLRMMVFYTGPTNKERLDRLFRKSALFDDKWDSSRGQGTYGSITIDSIISSQQTFYTAPANSSFYIQNNKTMFKAVEADELFCNFNLIPKARLFKAENNKGILLADLICGDGEIHPVEIDAVSSESLAKIRQHVPNWPWDTQCFKPAIWSLYMDWLKNECPPIKLHESTYYGILNIESKKPILLLPGNDNDSYVWISNKAKNTAKKTLFEEKDEQLFKEYLSGLSTNIPGYHDDSFIYPLLGWLCAAPVSSFLRHYVSGFPTCMVYGVAGSGKSSVLKRFAAEHFGATYNSFQGSTIFSIRRFLVSNNICPFIIDEYSERNEQHTAALNEVNKNLWDGQESSSGRQSGEVVTDKYVAPLLMAGELHYEDDPAAVDRTFSIKVDKTHLDKVFNSLDIEKQIIQNKIDWVYNSKWNGVLGRILIEWIKNNMSDIPDLIKIAKELVLEKCQNLRNERKIEGYIAVATGIIILREIYKDYGINRGKFLNLKKCIDLIINKDESVKDQEQTGNITLKNLFRITDKIIVDSLIAGKSLQPFLYTIDPDNHNTAYFDASRWQAYISKNVKSASTVSLSNTTAFIELIKDRVRQGNTPIVKFGDANGPFSKNCVTIDLQLIREQFNINTEVWENITNE